MLKKLCLLGCVLPLCSGQVCDVNVNTSTGSPLRDADATIVISRGSTSDRAHVTARITRGFSGVRFEDGQKVEVNEEVLDGERGDFGATVDASELYVISVFDPRRGTDKTNISEPVEFNITSPADGGDASLSGFTLRWSDADPSLEVDVEITQEILGESLSLELSSDSDTGELAVSAADLADGGFGQGVPIVITVTKTNRVNNVAGFDEGVAECRMSVSIEADPAP